MTKSGPGLQFLTVAEAAHHLGMPGLRVREAAYRGLVPAQRDNEGRLRVDLTGIQSLPSADTDEAPLEPATLLGLLFDEIEDLQSNLTAKDAEIAALKGLVSRQGSALDRADALLTKQTPEQPEPEPDLRPLLDKALGMLETQAHEAERAKRLQGVTEKAMVLLERAAARTEDIQARSDARVASLENNLETVRTQLDQTLALSERALTRAAKGSDQASAELESKRKGFWARIFGA